MYIFYSNNTIGTTIEGHKVIGLFGVNFPHMNDHSKFFNYFIFKLDPIVDK